MWKVAVVLVLSLAQLGYCNSDINISGGDDCLITVNHEQWQAMKTELKEEITASISSQVSTGEQQDYSKSP